MRGRFIILFLFFSVNISFAQSLVPERDSLLSLLENTNLDTNTVEIYLELAQLHLYQDPLTTILFCQKAIQLGRSVSAYQKVSDAYVQMFNAQLYYGFAADTILETTQQLEILVKNQLADKNMLRVHWLYALYYHNQNQTDKEIEAYIKALEIARNHYPNSKYEAGLLGNIGNILLEEGKSSEALVYFEKTLKVKMDDIGKANTFHSIGEAYKHQEKYDTALVFFKKAYLYNEKGNDSKGMARALIEEAKHYDRSNEFERASQIYSQTYELITKNNIGSLFPPIFVALAEHHQNRQNYQTAITFGKQSLAAIEEQQNYEDLLATYNLLQKSYAAVGDYQKAYEFRGKELIYKDSVSNATLATKVETLKTEFEVEQKEIENELLKAEAATNRKTLQSRNTTALALLLGLLLLGSWAVLIFRSNRQKQKYNEQLEITVAARTAELEKVNKGLAQANYELKTFNYIASHDIKEPIRNIGNYAGLIFRKLSPEVQFDLKDYFDNIKLSSQQLYTLVEDFSRYTQLSKDEDVEFRSADLNSLVTKVESSLGHHKTERNFRIINLGLPQVQTNSSLMFIIFKNLIENAIKFNESNCPTVTLSAKENDQFTEIIIEDNGIGIDPVYQKQVFEMFKRLHHRQVFKGSGIGLAIVKLLTDKLGGRVKLDQMVTEGSRFILEIPKV
ncbi:MAG: ATP-binding protein [Saprospiraceae bacterium]